MAHYVIAHRPNGRYTVTRFSDLDIPDHVGTVDLDRKSLSFDFYNKVTQPTLDKYLALVRTFIKDGEPASTVYFASEDVPPKITSHCYGISKGNICLFKNC